MISINKKCKIQGQVTTLQIMPFTKNRKFLKKPTNFSSRYVRICVKDATPPQTFLSFHALLCHSPTDCRTCCKNLRLVLVYIHVCIPFIVLSALFFLIFMPIIFQWIGAIPTTHLFCNRRGWDRRITFTVGNVDRYIDRYIGRRSGRQSIDTRSILNRHSVDCRSRVDRLSIECRSTVDRVSIDRRSTVDRYVDRLSIDWRSI